MISVSDNFIVILEELNQRTIKMALDLTNLTSAEARLVADVERLLTVAADTQAALAALQAQTNDPATAAALAEITAALEAEALKVEGVVPPPGPTGTTGATGTSGNTGP